MDEDLHGLLLRLGGALPPRHLADARFALARDDAAALLDNVTKGLAAARSPIAPDDLDRLAALAGSAEQAEALRATQRDHDDEPAHLFRPTSGDEVDDDVWVPPVLDLTTGSGMLESFTDDTDRAAIAAATAVPGVVAVWRTWRETVRGFGQGREARVFLVEVDGATAELAGLSAGVMAALADSEDQAPLVEMRAVEDAETTYFLDARRGAALLWAAEADRPVAIAKAFDGVDPSAGPYFSDDHPRLDDEERDRLLRYLEEAPVLLSSTERMVDIFAPQDGPQVSLDHRTDGHWTWTGTVPYYLRRHSLAPDPGLLAAIRENYYTVPEVTAVGRHRATAELFMPAAAEPVPAGGEVRN
ncbi:hypothetical protein [Actinoplanes sp. NPDC051494]|uniref:hypothetical protein n=1 Tax=Actinoplanes sp. NPDC051494 TaxID=3363907 RepID=UPI0037B434AD